ncbi:MAG: hypothetical protein JWQ42_5104 [Edaphobacter sp.]|nr:hypothetical protein [Edaphobacter sp.]
MSLQSTVPSTVQLSHSLHLHIADEECPSCGQVIPPEKLEEVKGKIASLDRERTLAITTNLESRFQQERAEQLADWQRSLDAAAEARKKAEEGNILLQAKLTQVEGDTVVAVEAARIEAKREAEELAAWKLTETENAHKDSEAALQVRIEKAEEATEQAKAATKKAVDDAVAEKLAEAQNVHKESEAALQVRIEKAEEATEQAKAATKKAVDDAVAEKLAEAQNMHKESEAALQARIEKAEADKAEADEQLLTKQAASDEAITAANAAALEAANQLAKLKKEQATALANRLEEQREAFDKDKENALNAQAAKTFEEHQKLTTKVGELTRALEKKSNEELGEGAELDLYEALRGEFPDDRITRVKKGQPGGDVIHVVVVKGRECGTIIYDSKNHKSWKMQHVSKLKIDQLAANAEHAILSTHKFPEGTGQLHMIDGVVLANPARVVLLAKLVRTHLIRIHGLQLSSMERETKTEALYQFITSDQCSLYFERVGGKAKELLDLQEKEIKWHKLHWAKQGETVRVIEKAKADLENQISIIIGTAAEADEMDEALEA